MNGVNLKEVREIFEVVVLPHLNSISSNVTKLDKSFENVRTTIIKQGLKIQTNTTRLDDSDKNFNKSVVVATLIIGVITVGVNLLVALYLKK